MRDINPDPYGPRSGRAGERSIRNVPLGRKTQHQPRPEHLHDEPPPRPRRSRRSRRRLIAAGAALLVCVAAGVLLSTVFAGAKVTVSPRVEEVTPPERLAAVLNPSSGELAYQPLTLTRSSTTTVPATGTKPVSRQASGVVTIENIYSSATQRLIANTRFEAPDGKIYRIRDSVTVPGISQGKSGTVMATIYADSPGEAYNRTSPTVFTIPGFKGDPRYSKFSARSEAPITGGFVGTEPAVADADLSKAKAEMQKRLNDEITAAAGAAVSEGFVAIPGTLKISFGATAVSPATGKNATVVQSASASQIVVGVADLAAAIARATVDDYRGEAVSLDPSSSITVAATSTGATASTITLTLRGTALLVWQFDPHAVRQALAGKPKTGFQTVLESFAPALHCSAKSPCEASIRPFWHSSFPADPDKIRITVGGDK